ncbi:MAG: citrate synthase, partial [Mesorhizobium sp.]
LATRRARGRSPQAIAESAIAWGEPAITTAISTVLHGRLVYRGKDAVALAATATLEEAASLLWASGAAISFASLTPSIVRESGTPTAFAR